MSTEWRYCPSCKGGNHPEARMCQWCGYNFPQPRANRSRRWLLLGGLLLSVCCVGVVVLSLLGRAINTPRSSIATNQSASRPTSTLAPLRPIDAPARVPTDTPEPATQIVEPTATIPPPAPPSPTPEGATASSDEQAYMAKVVDWSDRYSKALTRFSELNSDPKFGDESWTIDLAVQTVLIQEVSKEILEASAPDKFSDFHAQFQQAARHFDTSMIEYRKGVDSFDPEVLGEALEEMNKGNAIITELNAQLPTLLP